MPIVATPTRFVTVCASSGGIDFEHDREGASLLERHGVIDERGRFVRFRSAASRSHPVGALTAAAGQDAP
jgi:hypothetical protein